jgi:transposase InsO family protein
LSQVLIIEQVKRIRLDMPRIGCIKLHYLLKEDLADHNISIGRDGLFRLLKEHDMLVKRKRKYAITTDSNHRFRKWPDLTHSLVISAPGQLWVSDITYLRTVSGFNYLSLITDAYSHLITGYHLSQNLRTAGCIIALEKAIASLGDQAHQVMHHSDRGIQYCCDAYVEKLEEHKIKISMTQNGSPYENAMAERVNGILKTELGLNKTFANYFNAVGATHRAIDTYNRLRPHMSCNLLTPQEANNSTGIMKKSWKAKKRM